MESNVRVCTFLKWLEKIKQLQVEVARAPVPRSWRSQCRGVGMKAGVCSNCKMITDVTRLAISVNHIRLLTGCSRQIRYTVHSIGCVVWRHVLMVMIRGRSRTLERGWQWGP